MSRRIEVSPLPDGVTQRGSWQVRVSGRQDSTHTKKTAANRQARKTASPGDLIVIKRTDGTVQSKKTYQGSASGSNVGSNGHAWDVSDTKQEYDELTDLF